MAKSKLANPLAFTPWPVTIIVTLVYLTLAIILLVVNKEVPSVPSTLPFGDTNVTEAYHDLQFLSNGYHPYNSRRNDVIHDWILHRVDKILTSNGAHLSSREKTLRSSTYSSDTAEITVFDDMTSNLTFTADRLSEPGLTTYYEGNNVIVYIRGAEDERGDWWTKARSDGGKGVLVSAHYDSVPTGNGATDDGVGVVTLLQLIKHFSADSNQPKHGVVVLFNNGEENFLNGARAFGLHPTARFPTVFLNLEGAGAGGRALLFRTTDAEVTRKYKGTEHPFGTVLVADGFKRGLVRSQTDYIVFNDDLDMRGLDIAFFEPRARYHTNQDDARHTSRESIWHMLSAALHTMHGLTDERFVKHEGSDGVWFDLFGKSFAVFELHTFFAVSVTLLVVSPLGLLAAFALLSKADKLYPFSKAHLVGGRQIKLGGLRGLFRLPFLIATPTAIVVALAFLIVKVNAYVVHSSPLAVWSMMLSAWLFISWFLSRTTDFLRPSALHRLYACLWLFVIFWAMMIPVTAAEDNSGIASGYFMVWYSLAVAVAAMVGVLELFALDTKEDFAQKQLDDQIDVVHDDRSSGQRKKDSGSRPQSSAAAAAEEEPTESTSLLAGNQRSTFANYSINSEGEATAEEGVSMPGQYEYEQEWSDKLPSWTWIIQLLLLAPMNLILVGQISLVITSGAYQTLADGNDPLTVYLMISTFSTLLLIPLVPFLHRFTYHIPTICLLLSIWALIYNIVAFPFSEYHPLKFYFVQRVDLDTGINTVGLNGIGKSYIPEIISYLPSAAGQTIMKSDSVRRDLFEYSFTGLPPQVVPNTDPNLPPEVGYHDWLLFNATRLSSNKASFSIHAQNTKSCKIVFDRAVSDLEVDGSAYDGRFPVRTDAGSHEIRLWSREWNKTWSVVATWPVTEETVDRNDTGMDGRVVCMWNEESPELIPALQEVRRFAPPWSIVTSLGDGLVEGYKEFMV